MGDYNFDYSYLTNSPDEVADIAITAMIISLIVSLILMVVFVFVCRKIALGKNLSPNYMWFGLLGVIGVIIVAVIQPKQAYNPYQDPRYNPYNNQNPYMNQNPYANQNQYGQMNQYNGQMNQYNGQYNSSLGQSKVCGKCGASVGADTDFCPFCGNKVK